MLLTAILVLITVLILILVAVLVLVLVLVAILTLVLIVIHNKSSKFLNTVTRRYRLPHLSGFILCFEYQTHE